VLVTVGGTAVETVGSIGTAKVGMVLGSVLHEDSKNIKIPNNIKHFFIIVFLPFAHA
jgi:hypothetical protein